MSREQKEEGEGQQKEASRQQESVCASRLFAVIQTFAGITTPQPEHRSPGKRKRKSLPISGGMKRLRTQIALEQARSQHHRCKGPKVETLEGSVLGVLIRILVVVIWGCVMGTRIVGNANFAFPNLQT